MAFAQHNWMWLLHFVGASTVIAALLLGGGTGWEFALGYSGLLTILLTSGWRGR